MNIYLIVIISIGLAMDAFAVSITSGCINKYLKVHIALKIAVFFGFFQAVMPVIGWLAGNSVRSYVEHYDHWVAFALLTAVGAKMIYESFKLGDEKKFDPSNLYILLVLSVATSIDALVVGFSLSFLKVAIILPSVVIGVITFSFSFAGVYIGKYFGHLFENKIEFLAGVLLIGIGLKILIEHSILNKPF